MLLYTFPSSFECISDTRYTLCVLVKRFSPFLYPLVAFLFSLNFSLYRSPSLPPSLPLSLVPTLFFSFLSYFHFYFLTVYCFSFLSRFIIVQKAVRSDERESQEGAAAGLQEGVGGRGEAADVQKVAPVKSQSTDSLPTMPESPTVSVRRSAAFAELIFSCYF